MSAGLVRSVLFRLLPVLVALAVAAVLFAAWFQPNPAPPAVIPPAKDSTSPAAWHFTAFPAAQSASAPEPVTEAAPSAAVHESMMLSESSVQLVNRYLSTSNIETRVGILHDLADDGASGRAAFIQLFQREEDETLKVLIVNLADTVGEPSDNLFTLLSLAARRTEPEEVRDAGQHILVMTADPRAIPVWQTLLSDDDEDVREMAAEQIDQLRLAFPPEQGKLP